MKDITPALASPRPTRSASNNIIGRSNSSSGAGVGGGDVQKKIVNSRLRIFLKIGLALSVSFHFIWVAKQLSSLGKHDPYDGLLIAPELAKDGRDLYASSSSSSSSSSNRLKSSSPFDPRGKSLPAHPSPNADLQNLVSSHTKYNCPEGLIYVEDHILSDNVTHPLGRRIPRLFHITAKSRCMTHSFVANIDRWKRTLGSKYSIYIHDDHAVNKFIYQKRWMEFPELKEVMACVTAGAGKADIWRYIMVWEYGGVYSDMDSSPNKFNADSIADDDDAFFPLEMLGIPAQYWFAASPRHPVMFLSAKHSLQTMAFRDDISNNNAAKTTGPGAFKTGFILFQQFVGIETNGYVEEGVYMGAHGRSVKVVGSKANSNEWIIREGVKGKGGGYAQMGMTHFHATKGKFKELHDNQKIGCLDQRYKMHVDISVDWVNIV